MKLMEITNPTPLQRYAQVIRTLAAMETPDHALEMELQNLISMHKGLRDEHPRPDQDIETVRTALVAVQRIKDRAPKRLRADGKQADRDIARITGKIEALEAERGLLQAQRDRVDNDFGVLVGAMRTLGVAVGSSGHLLTMALADDCEEVGYDRFSGTLNGEIFVSEHGRPELDEPEQFSLVREDDAHVIRDLETHEPIPQERRNLIRNQKL